MTLRVECNGCRASAYTEDHQNPDAALDCACCTEDHDHAANANAGEPCRPLTLELVPGQVTLQSVIGG